MLPLPIIFHEVFPSDNVRSVKDEIEEFLQDTANLSFEFSEPVFKKMQAITPKELALLQDWNLQRPMFHRRVSSTPVVEPYSRDSIYDLFDFIIRENQEAGHADAIKILLIHNKNDQNWFSDYNAGKRVGFVQVSDWETHTAVVPAKAIAFEVLCVILRIVAMPDKRAYLRFGHDQPMGCINDHTLKKSEVIAKLRGADLCDSCLDIIRNSGANPLLVEAVFSAIQRNRASLFESKEFLRPETLAMHVCRSSRRLIFPDLELEVGLDPAEFVLYLMLLSNQQGVEKASIADYREQLLEHYLHCSSTEKQKAEKTIKLLCDPLDNSFNEKLSRLSNKLRKSLLRYAPPFLPVKENGTYKIAADRSLVRLQ